MIEYKVSVPEGHGLALSVSYAGTRFEYVVESGSTVVEQRHLSEFLAAVVGSQVVGVVEEPEAPAPAPESGEPPQEKE